MSRFDKIKNIVLIAFVSSFLFFFSAWNVLKPNGEYSVSERRPLAQMPQLSVESIADGSFTSNFETYSLDQFPMRDAFRTLKAVTTFYAFGKLDNNGIYIKDGYASKLEYPENYGSVDHAIDRVKYIYERYIRDTDSKVYISVIPDKNFFLADSVYPTIDYEDFFEYIKSSADFAKYIDITDLTEISDYYKTDTHWRQECIVDIADRLLSSMGNEVDTNRKYETVTADAPFYGVYYGQAALPLEADTLQYLVNDTIKACTVYDYETDEYIGVYDTEKLAGKDPYEVYLSGSKSLLTVKNPNATADKKLILIRDSFGSSIAPLMFDSYSEITIVDIRYISPAILGRFVDFSGSDVLFLYSTLVLNNSETFK